MKKLSCLIAIALAATSLSSCQKKSCTCQCKLAFTPGEHDLILKARSKRNADAACAYLNSSTQGNDFDGYYDCHLID